jgi:outer membrane lipoprotein-sorting protein
MSDDRQSQADPLDDAVHAFRQMAVPDPPPDADTLARLGAAPNQITPAAAIPTSTKGRFLMRLAVPSTAALILLGGAALVILTNTPTPTLADMIQAAEKYKLVKYKEVQTTDTKDFVGMPTERTVYADLTAPRTRIELANPSPDFADEIIISILDGTKKRWLMTDSRKKTAWLARAPEGYKSFLGGFQEFQQKKGVVQVKEKLGQIETVKYRLEDGKRTDTLWVDAKTKLPVRYELQLEDGPNDIVRDKIVWTDFEWDPMLPKGYNDRDALFDTTPPKDYALTDQTRKD